MKNLICLKLALASALVTAQAADFYVSNSGSDNNAGTASAPFKTIQKGLNACKPLTGAMTKDINVVVRGGVYTLTAPIALDAAHSGKNGFYVNLRPYTDEKVVISGGRDVPAGVGWSQHNFNIGKAQLEANTPSFRNLYVNGVKATRARSGELARNDGTETSGDCLPNDRNEPPRIPNPFKMTINPAISPVQEQYLDYTPILSNSVFNTSFFTKDNFPGVEFVYYNPLHWRMFRWNPPSVNTVARKLPYAAYPANGFHTIPFKDWTHLDNLSEEDRPRGVSWVENSLQLLDSPGEWYLNPAKVLYYYNPAGNSQNPLTKFTYPQLQTLVSISGASGNPVRNIRIQGLEFTYTGIILDPQWGFASVNVKALLNSTAHTTLPAAIEAKYVDRIEITNSAFYNLGADAIKFSDASNNILVSGNDIHDIGGSGISVGETNDVTAKDSTAFASGIAALKPLACNNVAIEFNTISKVGNEFFSGVGVFSGITSGLSIRNNTMTGLPYCGIYAGWGWDNLWLNIGEYLDIGYNFIEGANMRLHDGGAIYVTGNHGPNLAFGPKIHDNVSNFYQGTAGIYFDNAVRYATINNNVSYGLCGNWFYAQELHDVGGSKPIEHGIFPTYASANAVYNQLYGNTRGTDDHAYYWTGSDAPSNYQLNAVMTNTFQPAGKAPNVIDPQIGDVDTKGTDDRTKWYWYSANTAEAMRKSGMPPKLKIVREFSQAKADFDGSTLNLSVFQTLLMGNLSDMGQ